MMKAIKKIALLLVVLLVISPVIPAQAGTVEKTTNLIENDQLNSTDWFDAEDATFIEDGKLIVPADSFGNVRIISKTIAVEDTTYQTLFSASAKLQIMELSENGKFIFAMGLDSIEANSGEPGNIEVEFTNNGGLQIGVTAYDENGEASVLASPKKLGIQLEELFALSVTATTDRKLSVSINNTSVISLNGVEGLEGRIGFLQVGKSSAQFTQCTAEFSHYDRPENTNIFEDFETEIYNNNLFTTNFISYVRYPAYIAVEEFDGNNALHFYNMKLGYFGTKHTYSNFEFTFDVPYYLRSNVKDENGNTIEGPTKEFVLSFGDDALDFSGFGYATSTEAIAFTSQRAYGMNHSPEKFRVEYDKKGYFDPNTNEGFSVLLRVVDGHMELGMKSLNAENFDIIAEADYEDFRIGYIKLWSVNEGNFVIDNIKITNLDDTPNLTNVEFKSAKFVSEDFSYQAPELVFRPQEQVNADNQTASGILWLPIIITASVSAAVVLGSVVVSVCTKKRKSKEAA
jgi:hypothetical protein